MHHRFAGLTALEQKGHLHFLTAACLGSHPVLHVAIACLHTEVACILCLSGGEKSPVVGISECQYMSINCVIHLWASELFFSWVSFLLSHSASEKINTEVTVWPVKIMYHLISLHFYPLRVSKMWAHWRQLLHHRPAGSAERFPEAEGERRSLGLKTNHPVKRDEDGRLKEVQVGGAGLSAECLLVLPWGKKRVKGPMSS